MDRAFQPGVNDVKVKRYFPYRVYLNISIILLLFLYNSIFMLTILLLFIMYSTSIYLYIYYKYTILQYKVL
nr:MAG TPA: ER protein Pkr1 [Caudoviricetes sp.]